MRLIPWEEERLQIFAAADALQQKWRHVRIWGESSWTLAAVGDRVAIVPSVDGSSTALAHPIELDTGKCPVAEWTWRVDALPEQADLASRDSEDVAASLFFVFGDPGALSNPRPVPTIRYAWSTAANPPGAIVDSPYFPGTLRSIVVRSGPDGLGAWVAERRDLRADYEAAFGTPPKEPVRVVALFTDNDHLKEPVRAMYLEASALCTELPDEPWLF